MTHVLEVSVDSENDFSFDAQEYLANYEWFVLETRFPTIQDDHSWAIIALMSEVGELSQLVEKEIRKGVFMTRERATSELGDILWNVTNIALLNDISLFDLIEENKAKLNARARGEIVS